MRARLKVLVIGAGVSGLTTAVCLAEAGLEVRVRAEVVLRDTTSYAAGAMWGPYLVDDDRVDRWSEQTRRELAILSADTRTGVRLVTGLEAARTETPTPKWATEIKGYRESMVAELPAGFASGWWYTAPVVDMPKYLAYLGGRLRDAGVDIEQSKINSLREATAIAPIVVNCSGLGARELVPDEQLTPTRGQLVVVDNPGIDWFFAEHDESAELTYFLPHGDHVVLGGSAEPGRSDLAPDLATSAAIQRRCARIEPSLGRARVRAHRVGLRPTRAQVRVEHTELGTGHVIHNYGHGGSGVTLSWGCAREVLALARQI